MRDSERMSVVAELDLKTKQIILECSYEDKNIVKSLGANWSKATRKWYFPNASYPIVRDLKKAQGVVLGPQLQAKYRELFYIEQYSEKIKNADINDIPIEESYDGLYNHQKKTLAFGSVRKQYADLSDCGTGKTIATLAVVQELFYKKKGEIRVLVVAPKSIIMSIVKKLSLD